MFKKFLFLFLTFCSCLSASTKAVVFDFGGVMTGEQKREAVVQFLEKSFNLTDKEFKIINKEKHEAIKNGKNDIEFWLDYATKQKINLPKDWILNYKKVWKEALGINYQMYALIDELKLKKIKIALLSNIDERSKLIGEFGFYKPFSPCLLSLEIGYEKPNPKAYEILLSELKLPSEEVLFIDDQKENIEAAKKLGFDTILFQSYHQLREELFKRELLTKI